MASNIINKKASGEVKKIKVVGLNATDLKKAKALFNKDKTSAAAMRKNRRDFYALMVKAKATFPAKKAFGKWLKDNFPGINVSTVSKGRHYANYFEDMETWLINERLKPNWVDVTNIVNGFIKWVKANDPKHPLLADLEKTTNGQDKNKGTGDSRDNDSELTIADCIEKVGAEINRLIKKANKSKTGLSDDQKSTVNRFFNNAVGALNLDHMIEGKKAA